MDQTVFVTERFGGLPPFAACKLTLVAFVAALGLAWGAPSAGAVPGKVKRACKIDYKSLCPHYRAGTSRMRSCMRAKGSQLSWNCYEALRDHGYVKKSSSRR